MLLLGHSKCGVKTGASDPFCCVGTRFKQGGFASGNAAGTGDEGFVLMWGKVEVGRGVEIEAGVVDNLVVCRGTKLE